MSLKSTYELRGKGGTLQQIIVTQETSVRIHSFSQKSERRLLLMTSKFCRYFKEICNRFALFCVISSDIKRNEESGQYPHINNAEPDASYFRK